MLTKKYMVPMALGDTAAISITGSDTVLPTLQLSKLDMRDGVLSWEMVASTGQVFVGNATAEVEIPFFGRERRKCFVKPSLPIKLHVRNGACVMDVLFCIPTSAFIRIIRRTDNKQL